MRQHLVVLTIIFDNQRVDAFKILQVLCKANKNTTQRSFGFVPFNNGKDFSTFFRDLVLGNTSSSL